MRFLHLKHDVGRVMISEEVPAFSIRMKAKIERQELGSFFARFFSSSRADCKQRREGGSNLLVSIGILSSVGSDTPKVADQE